MSFKGQLERSSAYLVGNRPALVRFGAACVLLLVSLGTIASTATGAVFTNTKLVGASDFATGTLSISTSVSTALITISNMSPGDRVTVPITVTNGGSLQLRYAVTSTTTEDVLAAELALVVKSGVTSCTNGGFDASGTVIAAPTHLGSVGGLNAVGDPAQGPQAGDRTLDAGAAEVLCFNVALPLSIGNGLQGLSTSATLAFVSEQTVNN